MNRKIIVAVHGIGDQVEFATIQSVANRVYDYCDPDRPFTIPLGRFHSALKGAPGTDVPLVYFPNDPDPRLPAPNVDPSEIGFSEVYWADICRQPAREGYTLEESRKWVRTMVNRIRRFDDVEKAHRDSPDGANLEAPREIDYDRIELVLNEMIDTVNVVERLISVLVKMNLIKPFKLQALLNDFLGDVQFVAEFVPYRNQILARFNDTLAAVKPTDKDEIYFVAHSEGTVVTFLGLLQALAEPHPDWIKHVKGLMTIGSPIDKHLILWPEIWPKDDHVKFKGEPQITWWNYFDKGDPVGYELDTAAKWMNRHGWNTVFNLSPQTECGFTRYPLPGKAHNDYWTDVELFDHFLGNVVMSAPPPNRRSKSTPPKPVTKRLPQIISYVTPYLLFAVLLLASVYLLHKGVNAYFEQDGDSPSLLQTAAHVTALSCLLAGVTIMARIPRLTRLPKWHTVAGVVFLITSSLFVVILLVAQYFTGESSLAPYLESLQAISRMPTFVMELNAFRFSILAVALGALVAGIAYLISVKKPNWQMKPLIGSGAVVLAAMVLARVTDQSADQPLWPLVLAFVAFCLLWWMAALTFDLAFVWHLYIRWSVATTGLRKRQWSHIRELESESNRTDQVPADAPDKASGAAS